MESKFSLQGIADREELVQAKAQPKQSNALRLPILQLSDKLRSLSPITPAEKPSFITELEDLVARDEKPGLASKLQEFFEMQSDASNSESYSHDSNFPQEGLSKQIRNWSNRSEESDKSDQDDSKGSFRDLLMKQPALKKDAPAPIPSRIGANFNIKPKDTKTDLLKQKQDLPIAPKTEEKPSSTPLELGSDFHKLGFSSGDPTEIPRLASNIEAESPIKTQSRDLSLLASIEGESINSAYKSEETKSIQDLKQLVPKLALKPESVPNKAQFEQKNFETGPKDLTTVTCANEISSTEIKSKHLQLEDEPTEIMPSLCDKPNLKVSFRGVEIPDLELKEIPADLGLRNHHVNDSMPLQPPQDNSKYANPPPLNLQVRGRAPSQPPQPKSPPKLSDASSASKEMQDPLAYHNILYAIDQLNISSQTAAVKASERESSCCSCMGSRGLSKRAKHIRDRVFALSLIKLDKHNSLHIRMLQCLWRTVTRTHDTVEITGEHWGELGFADNDPIAILKESGFLTLSLLLHLSSVFPKFMKEIINYSSYPTGGFSWPSLGAKIVQQCLICLRSGALNTTFNFNSKDREVFTSLFCGAYLHCFRLFVNDPNSGIDECFREMCRMVNKDSQQILNDLSEHLKLERE